MRVGGSPLFSAPFVDQTSIVGWIVSFGGGAELLEPAEFRQDVLRFAENIREKYLKKNMSCAEENDQKQDI